MNARSVILLVLALSTGCTAQAASVIEAERETATVQPSARVKLEPEEREAGPGWVGVVMAREAVDLASEVEGKLGEVDLALGDWVEDGARLVEVDAPIVEAELDGARAALRSAEATEAESELLVVDARRQREREAELSEAGASSRDDHEQAELALDKAIVAERRAAATVAERRAEVARLEAQLAGGRLHAPFRGQVARWYRSPGEVVQAGERVVRIAAVDRLWVRFAVPVGDLEQVREGQRVEVALIPATQPIHAVVRHIAPELDLASQMMMVEAELEPGSDAEAGQACYVSIDQSP